MTILFFWKAKFNYFGQSIWIHPCLGIFRTPSTSHFVSGHRSFCLFAAFVCTYSVAKLWQQWWSNTTEQYYVILCCLALWKPPWCMNWRVLAWECQLYTCQRPQPWDPELDWGILSEPGAAARPTISWPHSRWLDSCRPRPVVSIGSAHEAKAASRQQQQYTERARYTDDSSITCRLVKWSVFSFTLCWDALLKQWTEKGYLCNKRRDEGADSGHPAARS